MNKRKIIVLRGIPGSGKTTWAKEWVEKDKENRIRINWDDLRNMFGPYWVPSREKLIKSASEHILLSAMKFGYDIVVDNTNIRGKEIFENYAIEYNTKNETGFEYQVEEKLFDVDLETCIERDRLRENPVGENVIVSMYKNLKNKLNGNRG